MVFGVIGGSGLLKSGLFSALKVHEISTSFGSVVYRQGALEIGGETVQVVFVQRHAADPEAKYVPPHLINHRAIMSALKLLQVDFVLGVCSVGSLHPTLQLGTMLLPNDYFCPHDIRSISTGALAHKMPTINEPLRKVLLSTLREAGLYPTDGGVYYQSRGPRFESKAEIRWMGQCGDVVGMTAAHEATLSGELDIPYAMFCLVDNMANGVLTGDDLTVEKFHELQALNVQTVEKAMKAMLPVLNKYKPLGESGAEPEYQYDTVLFPSHIVTVNQDNQVLEDHAIAVKDGKIVKIAPFEEARKSWTAKDVVELAGQAVMPGLINAHTHSPMTYLRGFGDDLPLTEWLTTRIWPAEGKCMGAEFVRDGSTLAIAEMIKGGTTCFNDMYFFSEETAEAIIDTGIRGFVGIIEIEFPSAYASNADEYLEKGVKNYEKYKDATPRLKFAVTPHSPYTVSEDHLQEGFKIAADRDLPFHIHLHETKQEVDDSVAGNKTQFCHNSEQLCRPFANLDRLGLIGKRTIAVHMTQTTDEEIAVIVDKQCHVVHCPSSNMKLASGFCPVAKLLEAGANVALGTDGCASNNTLDMFKEMHLAALIGKGFSGNAAATDANSVIRMATINGAKALNIDSLVGSIEQGKVADLIAVDLTCIESQPIYSVPSQLVYACTKNQVTNTWVEGKRLYANKEFTSINVKQVREKIAKWHDMVQTSTA